MHFCAQDGFAVMGVTIFAGLAMLVVAFSIMAQYGLLARIGPSGISLAVLLILVLMAGVHQGLRRIKSRRFRTGGKDPLFMRAFMQSCYASDCGRIEKELADRQKTLPLILNSLLAEKMQSIIQTDARHMVDILEMYCKSGLKKNKEPVMDRFFHTPDSYEEAPLPTEIEHIIQAVTTRYPKLRPALENMLMARAHLFTLMGDYLDLMPPSTHHFNFIKKTYRYAPPDDETTRRIAFALDTLKLLDAYRNQELRGERLTRHGRLAAERIPRLAEAVKAYKAAFENLVESYEALPMNQAPKANKVSSRMN
ncbi:MAG: hypothetical protein PVG19_00495 [Desulfobacterales bacterium]|jgi:hypothetical protein